MDYLNIYNKSYQKSFEEIEQAVKHKLIKACEEQRSFYKILNKIHDSLCVKESELMELLSSESNRSFKFYQNKHKEYQGDNVLELILKNECLESFNEEENNIDYEEYVRLLAKYEALDISNVNWRNNYSLYELMYDLGDFKDFSLRKIDSLADSKIYINLYKRKYPDSIRFKEIGTNNNHDLKLKTETKYNKHEQKIIDCISNLSQTEKMFLLSVCYNCLKRGEEIPLTEFARIMMIISIDDVGLFFETKDNPSYIALQRGIKVISSKNQFRFIKDLEEKIENLKLNSIKSQLSYLAGKLIKDQKK